jgi:hypothetical protein
MKLTLSHKDLELALIESLRAKGMSAFEPGKAAVDFSFKRGTKELICELDTEGKPAAPKAPAAAEHKPATVPAASEPVAPAAKPEVAAESATEAPAEAPTEQPAEHPVESPAATVTGEEENLFG